MTKKELAKLHSDKATLEKVECQLGRGAEHRFVLSMSLTNVELLSLKLAIDATDTNPSISDIKAFIQNAMYRYNNK